MAEAKSPGHRFDVEFSRGGWRIVVFTPNGEQVGVNGHPVYGSEAEAREGLRKAQPRLERVLLRLEAS